MTVSRLKMSRVSWSIVAIIVTTVAIPINTVAFSFDTLSRDFWIRFKSTPSTNNNAILDVKHYHYGDLTFAAPTTTETSCSRPPLWLYQSSSSDVETKVELSEADIEGSSKTELTRLKLKMHEIARSMDDAESRAEQAEREMETLRKKIKTAESGEAKNGMSDFTSILEDGSISAVLQEANEAIAESRRAIEASGESAELAIDQAENAARMKVNEEQKLWAAKRDLKAKLDELEKEKQSLQMKFWDLSEEKNTRIAELETEIAMERKSAEIAEERTRMMIEDRAEMEKRKDSMLQEQQLKKEMELNDLRTKLELATIKQEEARARVLALRTSKMDVQQAMKDHISSLQEELRSYESTFLKMQKAADDKYEAALKQQREQSKADMDERLARQEELVRKERAELVAIHQKQIDRVYKDLEKAKLTVERLQGALDQARKDSKAKIADLVKENTERMEELVERYESEREAMVQEFSDTLAMQDEAIEELQSLNKALNRSITVTKESHAKEIEALHKQFLSQRLQDKAEAERKRAEILRRHLKVLGEKNAKIAFYEEERSSIRKMMKQSYRVLKGRVDRRIPWRKSEAQIEDSHQSGGKL